MQTQNLIIALFQNTKTALQSIKDLKPKTDDKIFLDLLDAQEKRYLDINDEIKSLAKKHDVDIQDNTWFEKARLWTSIQFSTLKDNSTRHLAEMMLLGTVMGTLQLYKNRSDYKDNDQTAINLMLKLEETEEENFKELKKYLRETHD